jgi:serine/threonine protein kinase
LQVKGQLQYEAIIFNDTLQVQQTDYCFYIQPLTSLSVRYYRAQSTEAICLPARGEPPSRIVNITIIEQGNFVRALWHRPTVPSGMVTYSVCISFYRMDGNLLHVDKEFNITTTYYDLNVSRIPEDATDVSFQVSAINSFGATSSPTVVYKYNHTITTSPILEHSREVIGIVVGIVAAATIVVIIVVILIVVIFLLLGNQRKKVNKSIPVDLLLHPKEYEYKLYFKRLPPAMVDRWVIPRHMFNSESFHLLGEGNFSSVYFSLVHGPLSTPTKLEQFKNYVEQSVAVKILKANANEQEMEAFLNEADVLKVLSTQSCPYVVHLVGLQLEHAPPMIAMELVPCGNLLDILRSSAMTDENGEEAVFADSLPSSKKVLQKTDTQLTLVEFQKERAGSIDSYVQLKALSVSQDDYHDMPIEAKIRIKPSQLLKFAIQAVRGMEHLQFFGVLHRDIACRNLLLSANGIVKISDFGFACFLDGKSEVVAELPTDSKPLRWMSPEAFENDVYSEASDVWSFGVALWELFNQGKFPYPTLSDSDVMVAVKTGNYVECPENCDEKVYNLMLNCWMLNPNDRPTFSALKNTLEGFMYDLYPYMMVEVQEVPNE